MPTPILIGGKRSPLSRVEALLDEIGTELVTNPPDDPRETAQLVPRLKVLARVVRLLISEAETQIITRTTRTKIPVPNGLLIVRGSTLQRSDWDHRAIAARMFDQGATPIEVTDVAAIQYWRAGRLHDDSSPGLVHYGIQRDEFCTVKRVETVAVEAVTL